MCEDAPTPTDPWAGHQETACFVSHAFISLDWFPLNVHCFCDFKTKKRNEQMLHIGRRQEVGALREGNPAQGNELS